MLGDRIRSLQSSGPVFTPAGGVDASVKEEVQGPWQAPKAPETPSKEQLMEMAGRGKEWSAQWVQVWGTLHSQGS